jgi:hypothetical protein
VESALKLVGDRYQLRERQRMAVRRSSCSDEARGARGRTRVAVEEARGKVLWIDGFNLLITFATALRGGLLLRGRDGVLRDLASSHRLVLRTAEMLPPIAALLAPAAPAEVRWILDKPVSNSARVGQMLADFAGEQGLPWGYALDYNPDTFLIAQEGPVVTSDAMILDAGVPWIDLLSPLIEALPVAPWLLSLAGELAATRTAQDGGPSVPHHGWSWLIFPDFRRSRSCIVAARRTLKTVSRARRSSVGRVSSGRLATSSRTSAEGSSARRST